MASIEDKMAVVCKDRDEYIKALESENTKYSRAKIKALEELFSKPRVRLEWGCNGLQEINIKVYEGKLQQIKEAETAEDLKQILMPPKIYYNGCKVVAQNKWVLPEEELIVWSNTSMLAPLNSEGFDRYMELFKQVFPNEAAEVLKV